MLDALRGELGKVILGKQAVIERLLIAVLSGSHVLVEDVPGVGKTTLAKALAKTFAGDFRRLQFTPDLLPTDVLGSSVYDQRDGSFTFKPGPVFTNVLLADEINRASPRTQSALLEAMSERQTSIEGTTRALPEPFLVLATQNPVEFHGTYPLPEAQLDRFGLRVEIGYPDATNELGEDANLDVRRPVFGEKQQRLIPCVRGLLIPIESATCAGRFVHSHRKHVSISDFVMVPRGDIDDGGPNLAAT
ncbi:MAG: AAA family ATPase, partial [Polyangiales bacterium]